MHIDTIEERHCKTKDDVKQLTTHDREHTVEINFMSFLLNNFVSCNIYKFCFTFKYLNL